MRAVVQRVTRGAVRVDGATVGSIDRGVVVLVGIGNDANREDADYMYELQWKILGTRLWPNDEGKPWTQSVTQKGYQVLLVSQFTLHGVLKGNKPDFHNAMNAEGSKPFYEEFVELVKKKYKAELVQEGQFGAMMEVDIVNDGPVTILLDSRAK